MEAENRNEEVIFSAAIEIGSPIERAAFIKSACGDDSELLARVKALLKVHFEEDSFLKSPPAGTDITLDTSPMTGLEFLFLSAVITPSSGRITMTIREAIPAQRTYSSMTVKAGAKKLFRTKFNYRQWRKICKKAGLSDLKFHDLRRTFASVHAQNGISTAVTQRLLEHSSPNLTNKIYTNVDPVLRQSIERLPIQKWL